MNIVCRLSATIVTSLGLTDWIAETFEEYLELARKKSQDLSSLAELRANLRRRFELSPIAEHTSYLAAVEAEYRHLWRTWCQQQGAKTGQPR